ncbi:MAG: hypothetical protein OZSIB_0416 [Candidatus Ozemobacter sibiricus]|uniref:DUF4019 domain-containing protein n=1 Tax=Candidatus Ozemobacter sibiricus TaxID=2268124 RepID=A0A367ZLT1_9BACT|nr:MAG: hypothetical protein OZSIB_0416 [Candidatus Ozemobacter sibiricus]
MTRLLCLALVALTMLGPSALSAQQIADEETMKALEAMIDKALDAYNKQDWKAFYADFAPAMAAICTEQAFQTMYIGMYMNQFGQYKSRELIKEKTVVPANPADAPVGLLQYKAVFEKNAQVEIAVNITRDGNAWKLMQIQFNDAH